ncbi:hypothetical protein, partial [Salmonella enterica]|uniref:hypothetical protein n=1 Tax=Salmonella enterica TaxID=28901 RepID=UPI003CEF4EB2
LLKEIYDILAQNRENKTDYDSEETASVSSMEALAAREEQTKNSRKISNQDDGAPPATRKR